MHYLQTTGQNDIAVTVCTVIILVTQEHGPYNTDAENIDDEGRLLNPEKRWGGIMRKMDITDFDNSNIEYLQFWLMDPFLYNEDGSNKGGMLYFNFGEVSEDILKDLFPNRCK